MANQELSSDVVKDIFNKIKNGDINVIQLINEIGADINETRNETGDNFLSFAVREGELEVVGALLKAGANSNVISKKNDIFSVGDPVFHSFGLLCPSPIMVAIVSKKPKREEIISLLLEKGANVNYIDEHQGFAAIHLAAQQGELSIMKILLKNGADANLIAAKDLKNRELDSFKSNITPILLASSIKKKYKAGECIKCLLENGADINLNTNIPFDTNHILEVLAQYNVKLSKSVLKDILNNNSHKMEKETIQEVIKEYLNNDGETDKYLEKLLDVNENYNTVHSLTKYFAHLNSWDKQLGVKSETRHSQITSTGWLGFLQQHMKIKNMLELLKKIEKNEVDCKKEFADSKESITEKLKEEISNQVVTYFAGSQFYIVNKNKNPELVHTARMSVIKHWCEKIGNLKEGESFSIAAGTNDHSVYIEFKRQPDNNLSRIIYNLGGGSGLHPVSLDGKLYPHVVRDIPAEPFETRDYEAMDYLSDIIYAKKFPCYNYSREINAPFLKVYEHAYMLGGNLPKDLSEYISMKQQTVGNCTVKNNLNAIRNRLANDKLYKYLKEYEIKAIKEYINVPSKLYSFKERQKDLNSLGLILKFKDATATVSEKQIFRFLSKRANEIPKEIADKQGERVATAIDLLRDETVFDFYVSNQPNLINLLDKIEQKFKSSKLRDIINDYSKNFEIDLRIDKQSRNQEANMVKQKMTLNKSQDTIINML